MTWASMLQIQWHKYSDDFGLVTSVAILPLYTVSLGDVNLFSEYVLAMLQSKIVKKYEYVFRK